MLSIVLIILAVVVVAILIVVAIAATRPTESRIVRSATIAAPPEAVWAEVQDLHRWKAWSPWERLDPSMQRIYEGSAAGPGAVYRWKGNAKVGEGSMTIADVQPGRLVRIALVFLKPFANTSTAEFTFAPADAGTLVTWSMVGSSNLMCRAIGLFMDMDKMVGGQFAEGLANLRRVVEAGGAKP